MAQASQQPAPSRPQAGAPTSGGERTVAPPRAEAREGEVIPTKFVTNIHAVVSEVPADWNTEAVEGLAPSTQEEIDAYTGLDSGNIDGLSAGPQKPNPTRPTGQAAAGGGGLQSKPETKA